MFISYQLSLHKICRYSELFWSIFSGIQNEYGEIWIISWCSVRGTRITPNTDTFCAVDFCKKIQHRCLARSRLCIFNESGNTCWFHFIIFKYKASYYKIFIAVYQSVKRMSVVFFVLLFNEPIISDW